MTWTSSSTPQFPVLLCIMEGARYMSLCPVRQCLWLGNGFAQWAYGFCTMGMWLYTMGMWILHNGQVAFTQWHVEFAQWACDFTQRASVFCAMGMWILHCVHVDFWTMVKLGRPKKTCSLCLCSRLRRGRKRPNKKPFGPAKERVQKKVLQLVHPTK